MDRIKKHCFIHSDKIADFICENCRYSYCTKDKRVLFQDIHMKNAKFSVTTPMQNNNEMNHNGNSYEFYTPVGHEFCILCFSQVLKVVDPTSVLLPQAIRETKEYNFYFEKLQERLRSSNNNRINPKKYPLVCFQCGEKLEPEDNFCPNCGESTSDELEALKDKNTLEY